MTGKTLAERVAALEQYIEGDARLVQGVERLADETGGLNQILSKVDEQQQRLSRLGQQLEDVNKKVVPREELEKRERERATQTLEVRKKIVRRAVLTGVSLGLLLLVSIAGLAEYQQHQDTETLRQCRERNLGALKVKAYVTEQIAITRVNPVIPDDLRAREIAALENLGDSFPVIDCNNDGVRE